MFGIVNNYYHGDSIDYITNFLILLGKWYLNNQKTQKKRISFPEFIHLINDKINTMKMSYMMNDNLNRFMDRYGL